MAPTCKIVWNFARQIVQNDLSKSRVMRFINRNDISLVSQWETSMDRGRHNADSVGKYQLHFDLLQREIQLTVGNTTNLY